MGEMRDMVDDLWSIFECPERGVLFFSEEKVQNHLKTIHDLPIDTKYYSMEFIRAIPQQNETMVTKN